MRYTNDRVYYVSRFSETRKMNATLHHGREGVKGSVSSPPRRYVTHLILTRKKRPECQQRDCIYALTCLSSMSFASLTFPARYGLPPRSGWFASMMRRWASLIFAFERSRSLRVYMQRRQERQSLLRDMATRLLDVENVVAHLNPRM